MRLLVTRPAVDAEKLSAELRAMGHEVLHAPMMQIIDVAEAELRLEGVQAVLATSANGVRALARRGISCLLPLFAVGNATASAARSAGFVSVTSADGDVEALAQRVVDALSPEAGPLLHVAGTVTAGDLAGRLTASGFEVRRAVLYRAEPVTALAPEVAEVLLSGSLDGVLLYSPRTARLFVDLAERLGSGALASLTAYCLSNVVASEARKGGFGRYEIASRPDQESLLALLPGRGGA